MSPAERICGAGAGRYFTRVTDTIMFDDERGDAMRAAFDKLGSHPSDDWRENSLVLATFSRRVLDERFDELVGFLSYGRRGEDVPDAEFVVLTRLWSTAFFREGIDFFVGDRVLDAADEVSARVEAALGMSALVDAVLAGVPVVDALG